MPNCKSKNNLNCSRLNNWTEHMININTRNLSKALSYESSLMTLNPTINMKLGRKHPF